MKNSFSITIGKQGEKVLVTTNTVLTLHCAKCGKINLFALSRFRCGKRGNVHFSCECGSSLLEISRKARNIYCLRVVCCICQTDHCLNLPGREIWHQGVQSLLCENTGLILGYTGSKEEVRKAINKEADVFREITAQLEDKDFYINPPIMLQVLDTLRRLSESEQIKCSCGQSNLEMETYPDRVEIRCTDCQAVEIIFAESVRDLQKINKLEAIQLEAESRKCLGHSGLKGRGKAKNK